MNQSADEIRLMRVTAPHFCAGGVILDGRVTICAPIISYMKGWSEAHVMNYCFRKRWALEVNTTNEISAGGSSNWQDPVPKPEM